MLKNLNHLLFHEKNSRILHKEFMEIAKNAQAEGLDTQSLDSLVSALQNPQLLPAIRRNIVRILQFVEIPSDFHAKLYSICTGFLEQRVEIATTAFSMVVLLKIVKENPELASETLFNIEMLTYEPNASPGIKNRGYKCIKTLKNYKKGEK